MDILERYDESVGGTTGKPSLAVAAVGNEMVEGLGEEQCYRRGAESQVLTDPDDPTVPVMCVALHC